MPSSFFGTRRRKSRKPAQRSSHRRRVLFEQLEDRRLLAADWHNYLLPQDVNADRRVSPIDGLLVINMLESDGSFQSSDLAANIEPRSYYDTTGDGFVSPIDVLQVINAVEADNKGYVLTEITSLSGHYIQATFDAAVTGALFSPDAYVLTGPESSRLQVLEVAEGEGPNQVILMTDGQSATNYEVGFDSSVTKAISAVASVQGTSSVAIIDNGDPGFTQSGFVHFASGFHDDLDYAAAGNGSALASWTFTVDPGQYRVASTWVPYQNRATDAPYAIFDGMREVAQVDVNQKLAPDDVTDAGGSWENIADVDIAGTTLRVTLTNAANEYVIADAIRIEQISAVPDVFRPRLNGAASTSEETVLLAFSEPITRVDPNKFTIRQVNTETGKLGDELLISGTEVSQQGTRVTLRTLPQAAGAAYRVTVLEDGAEDGAGNVIHGVTDLTGSPIDANHHSE